MVSRSYGRYNMTSAVLFFVVGAVLCLQVRWAPQAQIFGGILVLLSVVLFIVGMRRAKGGG